MWERCCFKSHVESISATSFSLVVNASQFYFYSTAIACKEEAISDQLITAPVTQAKLPS